MKNIYLIALALAASSCTNSAPVVQNTANTSAQPPRNERPATVTAHTTENRMAPGSSAPSGGPGKWSASGDPVDTARFDGTIATAEKIVSSKPGDEAAKKDLAQAYYDRGVALTEARQYAAALGDYRRALKVDPNHEGSKNWIDQIEGIYKMLKKEPPREGEEPKPLPLNKD